MYRRTPLVIAALMLSLPAAAQFSVKAMQAAANDPKAFTIDEASVEVVKIDPPPIAPVETIAPEQSTLDVIAVLDSIVNLGDKIWKIVKDNAPVVTVKVQAASAVPEGIKSWTQLGGWQRPKGSIYEITAKNGYGMKVVTLRYQVLRTIGGNYKGVGKYLTAVTVEPLLIETSWGYNISLDASVPDSSIVNVGTSEAPIAAMTPQLSWTISTPIKHSQGKSIYYIQGDGVFQEIGGPFRTVNLIAAKAAIAKALGETLP